jgi:hypothetical protein
MKWVRGLDGLLCFGFTVFFTVATIQKFFLPSVTVTDIVYPNYKNIITSNMQGVAPDVCTGPSATHPSVQPTCSCLQGVVGLTFSKGLDCIRDHNGLPAEHKSIGRMNPNFIFFHIFMMSFVYQLVIRNSLDLDLSRLNRGVQLGVIAMFSAVAISIGMSLLNFDHGLQVFILLNFMPHQILLLVVSYTMYRNTHFDEIDPQFVDHYKKAIYSGVHNAATMPFMALLICILNSWTTMPMLQFMYTTVLLINVVDMAYNCAYIDSNKPDRTESTTEGGSQNAAKYRMRQAIYLLLVSLLLSLSIVIMIYFPQHTDTLHRVVGTVFIGVLWVLHIFFDCTKASVHSYQHAKQFNLYDGFVALLRYMLLFFCFYVVWAP